MPKFRIYGLYYASKFIGTFEADDEGAAVEKAYKEGDWWAGLCYHCSGEIDIGDCCDVEIEEVKEAGP